MERPNEVTMALNILKAMTGTFSPQTFWRSEVMRPIEEYIKGLEDELTKQGMQATFEMAVKINGNGDDDDKDDKNKAPSSARVKHPIE